MVKPNKIIKRRQYFIAPKFQSKYIGIILMLMFATAALCSYVVYYTTMLGLGEKLANVYPQGRLVSIVNTVNLRMLISLLLVTPLVAMIGLFLSHRIAGPIYRMEQFLNDMAGGDLSSRLSLRKKDELVSLADGINNLLETLKNGVLNERTHLDKIQREVAKLKLIIESKPINETAATEVVHGVSGEVECIAKEIGRFKI